MQNTTTLKLSNDQQNILLESLDKSQFQRRKVNNPYVIWSFEGQDLVIMMYSSGSLVIQGLGDPSTVIKMIKGIHTHEFERHLGSDEVGKGDYFGPLVVTCAYIDEKTVDLVSKLGITDSKKLSDNKILTIYEEIKNKVVNETAVVYPGEYNTEIKKFRNVAFYLANIHRRTAEKVMLKDIDPKYIVIDQFSVNKSRLLNEFKGINIPLDQHHKAESDVAVATASVIARATFLLCIDDMSQKYDFHFPKGASNVIESGKAFVQKYGKEELYNVAKISFKTTDSVLSLV